MNPPYNGCPIVRTVLMNIRGDEGHFDPISTHNWEDWDELEEEAEQATPSDDTIRLRAFYAIELIYSEVIPRQLFSADVVQPSTLKALVPTHTSTPGPDYIKKNYPRSCEGLAELSADANRLRGRLAAMTTISVIKKERRDASLQWADIFDKIRAIVELLQEAVDILCGCLRRRDTKNIIRIGEILYMAMLAANYTSSDTETELRTLLTIHRENAIAPWQKKKSYQG